MNLAVKLHCHSHPSTNGGKVPWPGLRKCDRHSCSNSSWQNEKLCGISTHHHQINHSLHRRQTFQCAEWIALVDDVLRKNKRSKTKHAQFYRYRDVTFVLFRGTRHLDPSPMTASLRSTMHPSKLKALTLLQQVLFRNVKCFIDTNCDLLTRKLHHFIRSK